MATRVVLSGSLDFLCLGDILQLLGSSGATGVLRIMSKYSSNPGYIYFQKGNIVHGSTPENTGLEAVYALFGWMHGEYEFSEGDISCKHSIQASRMEIILDGLRMVDDGITETQGPVQFEKASHGRGNHPVIRGPLVDYFHVVDEESFAEGFKIIEEKRHGSWIWVILEGTVNIVRQTTKGPLIITKLGTGSFIGSVGSFLYKENARRATAVADSKVQLGVLDIQRLAEEFSTLSPQMRNLIISIDRRRHEVTNRVVHLHEEKNIPPMNPKGGKQILKEGGKMDKLYMIKSGEAHVIRNTPNGNLLLAQLFPRDFFGNIPFVDMGHEPQHAGVMTSKSFEATPVEIEPLQEEFTRISYTMRHMIESIATGISVTTQVAVQMNRKKAEKGS